MARKPPERLQLYAAFARVIAFPTYQNGSTPTAGTGGGGRVRVADGVFTLVSVNDSVDREWGIFVSDGVGDSDGLWDAVALLVGAGVTDGVWDAVGDAVGAGVTVGDADAVRVSGTERVAVGDVPVCVWVLFPTAATPHHIVERHSRRMTPRCMGKVTNAAFQ